MLVRNNLIRNSSSEHLNPFSGQSGEKHGQEADRPWDLKLTGFINEVLYKATDATLVVPMLLASPFCNLGRVMALRGLLAEGGATWMSRGLALKILPEAFAFGLENTAFTLGSHALTHHLVGPVAWDAKSLAQEWAFSGMNLGLLKSVGFAGRQVTQWKLGLNELPPQLWTKADHLALSFSAQASGYLGLVGSSAIQRKYFSETHPGGGNIWIDSLGTHLALGMGGSAGRAALGSRFHAIEQRLSEEAHQLYLKTKPEFNIFGTPSGMIPAAAVPAGAALAMSRSEMEHQGPSKEHIFNSVGNGDGNGRVDPRETLGVLPTGSLTPHGDDISTHQRAVGDKKWIARMAAYNSHLKYEGDGKYKVVKADPEKNLSEGQILSEEEVASYFEETVKGETGFRRLVGDKPLETDWAGQIPTGFRGPDGETENTLLNLMGLTKGQIKELSFSQSGTLITRADAFALQGLFALYRSAVQWGAPLREIVGNDPRKMAIAAAAGLGGMNNLIDLITASPYRQERKGQEIAKTKPGTQPLWLASSLIDSMMGLLAAVLGPNGDSHAATLRPNSIIQNVGRIPVNVGACATGYKTFVDAADMFRPNWPGQMETSLAFFASSEAAHGRAFARPEITGFNAATAMETREQLEKRKGRLEDGYAPLTTDVGGFWPSEGAGAGALMVLHEMFRLGLPIHAAVLGYSVMGDQGGKPNPASLGIGGLSTMMESLRMMSDWQKTNPNMLRYMSLHGTGTKDNNEVEPTNLLKALEAYNFEGKLKLSAFKALLGHGLGSAGAMEIALLIRSLHEQVAPGAFNLEGRELADTVKALGDKVEVNSEVLRTNIHAAGGQSQGFAGNNATALFRHVNDQVLHEVYGYSIADIEAYRRRLSERLDRANKNEEAIRKEKKTIGEFLSWFGLGDPEKPQPRYFVGESESEPESPVTVDLRTKRASSLEEAFKHVVDQQIEEGNFYDSTRPQGLPALLELPPTRIGEGKAPAEPGEAPRVIEGPPNIRKGIPVDPSQMMVSVGRGAMLTTRGGTLATRSAAMNGIDHPKTLMYLGEDAGLASFIGRDSRGREQWVNGYTGEPITPEQLAEIPDAVEFLLTKSGPRNMPLEGMARELPVRHGALLPEWMRGRDKVRERIGAPTEESLADTPFANQWRNLNYASDMGMYGLYVALDAQAGIGFPLRTLMESTRFGAAQGSAFPGADRLTEIYDRAKGEKIFNVEEGAVSEIVSKVMKIALEIHEKETGKKLKDKRAIESVTYALQSALMENPRGLYLNLIMPHLDYVREVVEMKDKALAAKNLQRILPERLAEGKLPNTGGVNLTCSQACASGLYALFLARLASMRTGLPGEVPMDAFMVFGADATFSPFHTSPAVAGFSVRAPMTVAGMVKKLRLQGLLPADFIKAIDEQGVSLVATWERLPDDLRRRAMSEASAPFSQYADGLVVAEGAAAMSWFNYQKAIEAGLWPSSRLLGIHVNAGEGGIPNLASLDQGIVTAVMVALQQAKAHGVIPLLFQAHGTSTKLSNYAEILSLSYALRQMGMSDPMVVTAIKGLLGHTMGAAGAMDIVMGVHNLLDGEAPGLFNFRMGDLDPRFAKNVPEVLEQFKFSPEPVRGNFDGVLIASEGFLSADAAAVLGHFPQDIDQAADMLRDYNFPSHVIADWKAKAAENRERGQQVSDSLRKREMTHLDIAAQFGFNPVKTPSPTVPPSPLPGETEGPLTRRHGRTVENTPRALKESLHQHAAEKTRTPADRGIGVKTIVVEEMKSSLAKEEFLQSNFTQAEIDYCRSQKNPESFFARWMAAKVAVMDAITAAFPVHQNPWSETPPPPLHEVEILSLDGENVTVTLKGSTLQEASKQGINAQQASLISENGLVTGIAKVQ